MRRSWMMIREVKIRRGKRKQMIKRREKIRESSKEKGDEETG